MPLEAEPAEGSVRPSSLARLFPGPQGEHRAPPPEARPGRSGRRISIDCENGIAGENPMAKAKEQGVAADPAPPASEEPSPTAAATPLKWRTKVCAVPKIFAEKLLTSSLCLIRNES